MKQTIKYLQSDIKTQNWKTVLYARGNGIKLTRVRLKEQRVQNE